MRQGIQGHDQKETRETTKRNARSRGETRKTGTCETRNTATRKTQHWDTARQETRETTKRNARSRSETGKTGARETWNSGTGARGRRQGSRGLARCQTVGRDAQLVTSATAFLARECRVI